MFKVKDFLVRRILCSFFLVYWAIFIVNGFHMGILMLILAGGMSVMCFFVGFYFDWMGVFVHRIRSNYM